MSVRRVCPSFFLFNEGATDIRKCLGDKDRPKFVESVLCNLRPHSRLAGQGANADGARETLPSSSHFNGTDAARLMRFSGASVTLQIHF